RQFMASSTASVLNSLKALAVPLVWCSAWTNLSVLVTPLFMMQVLDRVVPSGNLNTLALLGLLALIALITNALIEFFRDQALGKTANWVEESCASCLLTGGQRGQADRLRDVATLRDFLSGRGALSLLDLPFVPLFLGALFLIHSYFLILALGATLVLGVLNLLAHTLGSTPEDAARQARESSLASLRGLEREGPAATLMSIGQNLAARYLRALLSHGVNDRQAARLRNLFGALTRFLRTSIQIGTLSLGAALVTTGDLTAGGMIGASIVLGKTIGILEGAISGARQVGAAHAAAKALRQTESAEPRLGTHIADLSGALKAENLTYPRGGGAPPRIERLGFRLAAGECLAILGESGSGKSTLLHALSGIDPAPIGNTFYDESDVRTLSAATRDAVIGYVPQQAQILDGTIAENIARFSAERDDEKVLEAARLAGIHGMVSALPLAYETDLGATPYLLSAGQKQRLAFARAVYEPPRYLFLDEPNALLDHNGERQLGDAIRRLKSMGTTIVLTAHRMGIVNLADQVLVLERGRAIEYGARAEILGRMANGHRRLKVPLSGGALQDLSDWVARQFVRDGDEAFTQRATVVATELYNFARKNGPESRERLLAFEFRFIDDHTCSITLTEARKTQMEAKIHKVKAQVDLQGFSTDDLPEDEASLAMVFQLADNVAHSSKEGSSALCARITHNLPSPQVVQ
ncbi:MAG: ATP-binding cassette domain-containing protein, partial [Pseudomonadota bacterium]